MDISELDALTSLVEARVLNESVASVLREFASRSPRETPTLEGTTLRPLVLLLDKSGSMKDLVDAMIAGQKHLINALMGSSKSLEVHLGQILFDDTINYFQQICPLRDPLRREVTNSGLRFLDQSTYKPGGTTALYDSIVRAVNLLAPVLLTAEACGQQVLAHIAILTDGKDVSSQTTPANLKRVIEFLLESGAIHRFTLCGLGDDNFIEIGRSIGIPYVTNGEAGAKEIRAAMDLISSRTVAN